MTIRFNLKMMIKVLCELICYKTYKLRYALSIIFSCLLYQNSFGQNAENTVDILVKLGFENISWDDTADERIYVLENAAYRLNGVGVSKAVEVVLQNGMPEDKSCRLIFLKNNVPQISIFFNSSSNDSIQMFRKQDWEVSYDLGKDWRKYTQIGRASCRERVSSPV